MNLATPAAPAADGPTRRPAPDGRGGRWRTVLLLPLLLLAVVVDTARAGSPPVTAAAPVDESPLVTRVGEAATELLPARRADANTVIGLALLATVALGVASALVYRAWRRADGGRRALARERLRLRALLLTASEGMHVLDRSGWLVESSPAFAALLGRSPAELEGAHVRSWDVGSGPEDAEARLLGLAEGQRLEFSSRFRRADGRLIDVDLTAVGARIDGQDLIYLAARDVTDRNRSIAALLASETFLDRTGRIAGVGGWEFDPHTRSLRVTGHTRRLLGLSWGEPPSHRRCLSVLSRASRRCLFDDLRRATLDGLSSDLELPATAHNGRTLWLRWFAEPVFDDGDVVRWVGAVQDISERLERSAELQREQALRSQVEGVLRERGEMLDVMAHEVRQPLNNASAALQSAGAALRDLGEQVASARLGRAQAVLGQVMARIDNTLAVASQLARPGPLDREETDIDMLLGVVVADMPASERPRVRVQRETAARTAAMDMSLMRLALRNLLSNALKFSPPDSPVTIRLADSEQPLGLLIDVEDRGSGVPAEVLPRLFQRGARGPAGTSQGLGLYIVRRVMELHAGHAELLRSGADGTTMRLLVVATPDE